MWTSLTDPRTDTGTAEVIALCEALVEEFEPDSGRIYESDGTIWVTINHPSLGEGCVEA